MTDLFKAMAENERSAINILKSVDSQLIEFDRENIPYVLLSDNDDNIRDLGVTKVCLNDHGTIEMYVDSLEEWVSDADCLSTTANNVYEAMDKQVFGN